MLLAHAMQRRPKTSDTALWRVVIALAHHPVDGTSVVVNQSFGQGHDISGGSVSALAFLWRYDHRGPTFPQQPDPRGQRSVGQILWALGWPWTWMLQGCAAVGIMWSVACGPGGKRH